jgi:UDP-2,3-diacylglucosamine pyrophosphatase LpxH
MQQKDGVTRVHLAEDYGELRLMLCSDVHFDSIYCNRALYKKHLDEAKSSGAFVIMAGDCFDAMQGRYDTRRSYTEIRPEYVDDRYYDLIVNDFTEFHKPYKDNLLVFGKGNHDTSIIRHANIDLLSRAVGDLRKEGSNVVAGGYGGWIVFYFGDHYRANFKIRYFHGSGGEAEVTKGMIQVNRQATYLPDADLVLNGHNHNNYITSIKRQRISNKGEWYEDKCTFVRTPGYKNAYADGSSGWEVERGANPKNLGCIWAAITINRKRIPICKCTEDIS